MSEQTPASAPTPPRVPAGRPRPSYQRSVPGLIGAMIITVVVVLGYVGCTALKSDRPTFRPDAVDYLPAVQALQEAGRTIVYPPTLPKGWTVTSIDTGAGKEEPVWRLGMLTSTGTFVGLRQLDASPDSMVAESVDEAAQQGDPYALASGEFAGEWDTYTDKGGDYALVRDLDNGETLMVYGSATPDDVRRLAALLTTAPASSTTPQASSEPSPSAASSR